MIYFYEIESYVMEAVFLNNTGIQYICMVSVEIKYLLFNICVLYIIKKGRKGCDKPSHLRVSVAYLHLMEGDRSSGFSVPYLITLILVITYQVNRVIN